MSLQTNTLYYGDCLDWMGRWADQSVDLIYLDPPFNSKANYNVLYSDIGVGTAQYRAFRDTWQWDEDAAARYDIYESGAGRPAHSTIVGLYQFLGPSGVMAYLTYMAERLEHMRRLLKPGGSIYFHCDPTVSHYLKIVMDAIFGSQNFRNEIVWCYTGPSNTQRWFPRKHDTIFFYAQSSITMFNRDSVRIAYNAETLARRGRIEGSRSIISPSVTVQGRRSKQQIASSFGDGKVPEDYWTDVAALTNQAEYLGYPTQKPLALLERIIKASSNEGDVVLDPICGCGTAIEAAKNLNRQWIGVDISAFAIDLIVNRRLQDPTIPTKGIPYDLASARKLAREEPFNFESWAVTRIPGFIPNTKQVADGGVDGRATLVYKPENYDSRRALAQVKGGKFSLSGLRDFIGVTDSHKAAVGCFITLEPVGSQSARETVVNTGRVRVSGSNYPRMQIWPISDYFDRRPPIMPMMTDPYSGKPLQMVLI